MLILIHIILALGALALATQNFFKPTHNKLNTSYGIASGVLASGILLIVMNNASILRTCLTGIMFFSLVALLNEQSRRKLAADKI